MMISKNFSLEELTASATAKAKGLRNEPGQTDVISLCALVHRVLQPLREAMGEPIKIGSGYRSLAVNRAVGGVSNSQHMRGEAADIRCADNKLLAEIIEQKGNFDQLIIYPTFLHVSYKRHGNNRKQIIIKK